MDSGYLSLSHFAAALVCAFFASIVLGITHRNTTRDMLRYGAYCFSLFLGGVIAAGWLMRILKK